MKQSPQSTELSTARAAPNWDKIREEYSQGDRSPAAIAVKHRVTIRAIEKRVAKEGWTRDIQRDVRAAAAVKSVMADTKGLIKNGKPLLNTEVERLKIVDAASDRITAIVSGHKDLATKAKTVLSTMLETLITNNGQTKVLNKKTGEIVEISAKEELNAITTAMAAVVKIERQAYGIDDFKGAGSASDREQQEADELKTRRSAVRDITRTILDEFQAKHLIVQ